MNTKDKDPVAETTVQVNVGDITVSYQTFGSGPPLLMIMGYGSTMNLWEPLLVRQLATHFQVILFDNRGMGGTTAGTYDFSIGQFALDCAGLLDALKMPKAHVLGWSMGAMIAQELAIEHPAKVKRLILYAAHSDASLFPPAADVLQRLTDTSGTSAEQGMRAIRVLFPADWLDQHGQRIAEIFYRPMGNISPQATLQQSMAIANWRASPQRLSGIRAPTLLIAGANDVLVPPQNSGYLKDHIPGAQCVEIDDAGHGLMFQYPDAFAQTVIEFLKQ